MLQWKKQNWFVFQMPYACAREAFRKVKIPRGVGISFDLFYGVAAAGESLFTGGRHYLLVNSNSPESLFTGK